MKGSCKNCDADVEVVVEIKVELCKETACRYE